MCSVFQRSRFQISWDIPTTLSVFFFLQIFIFSFRTLLLLQSPTLSLSQLALTSHKTIDQLQISCIFSGPYPIDSHRRCIACFFKLMLMLMTMIIFSQSPLILPDTFFWYPPLCSWHSTITSQFQWHLFQHFFLQPYVLQYTQSLTGMSCTIMREVDQTGFLCLWSPFLFWLCERDIKTRPYSRLFEYAASKIATTR